MKKNSYTRPVRRSLGEGGFFNLRALIGFTLCFVGVGLALFASFPVRRSLGVGGSPLTDHVTHPGATNASRPLPYMPAPGAGPETDALDLGRLEQFWNDRLTYPTGRFNPRWLRAAAAQHARLPMGVPAGVPAVLNPLSPLTFSTTSFIG